MKTIYSSGLMLLLVMATLVSCKKKEEEKKEDNKIKVKTEIVRLQTVQQQVTFTATVEGEAVNYITPSMPTRIKKIYVDVGAKVSKGQTLVQMDNSNFEQQRVQLENLERDYKRYEELLKVGGVSQQQVDQMKVQLDVARTANQNIKENTTLSSPISGVVTERNYDDGDVFGQKPILCVQQLNPVKAVINISESYFPKVKQGMPVNIKLDIYGDEIFPGKIKLIYPTVDPNTHTFACEIEIANNDLKIRPGMFARVDLNFGEEENVVVPDASVIKQTGSNDRFIYTIVNGKAVYNKVLLGQRLGDKWEIRTGIKTGDEIVTAGHTRLVDGSEVEIIKE